MNVTNWRTTFTETHTAPVIYIGVERRRSYSSAIPETLRLKVKREKRPGCITISDLSKEEASHLVRSLKEAGDAAWGEGWLLS